MICSFCLVVLVVGGFACLLLSSKFGFDYKTSIAWGEITRYKSNTNSFIFYIQIIIWENVLQGKLKVKPFASQSYKPTFKCGLIKNSLNRL